MMTIKYEGLDHRTFDKLIIAIPFDGGDVVQAIVDQLDEYLKCKLFSISKVSVLWNGNFVVGVESIPDHLFDNVTAKLMSDIQRLSDEGAFYLQ